MLLRKKKTVLQEWWAFSPWCRHITAWYPATILQQIQTSSSSTFKSVSKSEQVRDTLGVQAYNTQKQKKLAQLCYTRKNWRKWNRTCPSTNTRFQSSNSFHAAQCCIMFHIQKPSSLAHLWWGWGREMRVVLGVDSGWSCTKAVLRA